MIHSFSSYLHASNDPLFSRMLERCFLAILRWIEIAFGKLVFYLKKRLEENGQGWKFELILQNLVLFHSKRKEDLMDKNLQKFKLLS